MKYNLQEVRYITISSGAQRLVDTVLRNKMPVKNIYLLNKNITSCEEGSIDSETFKDVDKFVYERTNSTQILNEMLQFTDHRYNRREIDLCLKQEIAAQVESSFKLLHLIAIYKKNLSNETSVKNLALIKNHYWKWLIQSDYEKRGIELLTYTNIKESMHLLYVPLKICIEILVNTCLMMIGRKINTAGYNQDPKIAVFQLQGTNLEKRTDYFWYPNSGIDPQQILLYFKYAAQPPTQEAVQYVEQYNIPWISLMPWKIGSKRIMGATFEVDIFPTKMYISKLAKIFITTVRSFFYCLHKRQGIYFFAWKNLMSLLHAATFFETFFRTFNIKLHFALHVGGRDMVASSMAMELVGGSDLCSHWSLYDMVDLKVGKTHDVFFCWGTYFTNHFFNKDYFYLDNIIYTGYPYDSFFGSTKAKAFAHLPLTISSLLYNVHACFLPLP